MPSDDIAISVRNLTKTYRIFGHPGDRLKQALTFGLRKYHKEFTSLKDVSFDIQKGETVGIIGRNGSGKSTLLQLICGILKPTFGSVQVNGRISALLELGAGFNPEFTGRENVYFQGALMGLSKEIMDRRFEDIAAFADIGEFINQPVRMYSSGMYLRLAFAVAVNVDSDILVVDEALAVGDAGFRSRCYRHIGKLREAGCTIIFVSHDLDQVVRLCGRVILLDEGEQLLSGRPECCVAQFQRLLNVTSKRRTALRAQIRIQSGAAQKETNLVECVHASLEEIDNDTAVAYEPNGAVIEDVRLLDQARNSAKLMRTGQKYRCIFRTRFMQEAKFVRCALLIITQDGHRLGGAMTAPSRDASIIEVSAGSTATAEFEFQCILNPGIYLLNVAVFGNTAGVEYILHGIQGAVGFRVEADNNILGIGAVNFGMKASVSLTNAKPIM